MFKKKRKIEIHIVFQSNPKVSKEDAVLLKYIFGACYYKKLRKSSLKSVKRTKKKEIANR